MRDGEYAERSAGNYNAVVNNAMLALWQETGNDFYLDCVRRNLTMMLDYIDPDGYVFTQNSTRQDLGRKDRPDLYFYQYLAVCSHEPNEAFDAAAHEIIRSNQARGDLAPDCLHILMNHPEMAAHVFSGCGFPAEYRRFFPRFRRAARGAPGLFLHRAARQERFSLCEARRAHALRAAGGKPVRNAEFRACADGRAGKRLHAFRGGAGLVLSAV